MMILPLMMIEQMRNARQLVLFKELPIVSLELERVMMISLELVVLIDELVISLVSETSS
jgi:hypothetical protein